MAQQTTVRFVDDDLDGSEAVGTVNFSLETLWALGTALGVPLSRLIDPPKSDIRVIRAGEGPVTYAERASYAATLLASHT